MAGWRHTIKRGRLPRSAPFRRGTGYNKKYRAPAKRQKLFSSYHHYIAKKPVKCLLIALAFFAAADCFFIRRIRSESVFPQITTGDQISKELTCFPLPASAMKTDLTYGYVDSWMAGRSFGGKRRHEGCDIMLSENRRGVYPVTSMTDGVVESLGWLKLGGWRVGIRADSGTYYYYAHMESYCGALHEGSIVSAGEFLGFVGDSGYGPKGTTGQFAAHLHVGIYVPDQNGEDRAINPYPYLQSLETNRLTADFTLPEEKGLKEETNVRP